MLWPLSRIFVKDYMRGFRRYIFLLSALLAASWAAAQNASVAPPRRPAQHAGRPVAERSGEKEYAEALATQSPALAFLHLNRSAYLKHSPAYAPLARCYAEGRGTSVNDSLAYIYFRLAADDGDADSGVEASLRLLRGNGIQPDTVRALASLRSLAGEGHIRAARIMAEHFASEADYQRAIDASAPYADQGEAWAMATLGKIYASAPAPYRRMRDGALLLRRAEALGDSVAAYEAGRLEAMAYGKHIAGLRLLKGETPGKERPKYPRTGKPIIDDDDFLRGLALMREAADMGDAEAAIICGIALTNGNEGRYRDKAEAMACFNFAKDLGEPYDFRAAPDPANPERLFRAYLSDPASNFDALAEAAMRGHRQAALRLSQCYMSGEGTAPDKALADEWAAKALLMDAEAEWLDNGFF